MNEAPVLRPFFPFYGSKWRLSGHLPPPTGLIVEPFAGSAGYSLRYGAGRDVLLIEKDPVLVGIWRYLQSVSPEQVLALPDIEVGTTVKDYGLTEPEQHLIGYWLNKGSARPCKSPGKWMRDLRGNTGENVWGPGVRQRIARQVPHIARWHIELGDYAASTTAPRVRLATWIIDPPYQRQGRYYAHGSEGIDFQHLSAWSKSRRGQTFVHEQEGADWLPFRPFREVKATSSRGVAATSREVLWTSS